MSFTGSKKTNEYKQPSGYFELFFDKELRNLTLEETNRYALQNNVQLYMTKNELFVFIGRLLLSATSATSDKRYWVNGNHVSKILANNMHCDRFMAILKNLHFADNTKVDKKSTRAKLSLLFYCLLKKFHAHASIPRVFISQ